MNNQIAGHCGKCGAPYWLPEMWHGTTPPTPTPSCACWSRVKTVTSTEFSFDLTDPPTKPDLFLLNPEMTVFEVPTAGSLSPLMVDILRTKSGDITDGVSFRFAGKGHWVVSIGTLRNIVKLADDWRENNPARATEGKP